MTGYNPIGDIEIDPESPVTTSLMARFRDNPIAQMERAPGAPEWGATVDSNGNNANGYYRIWSDGFIEQWGQYPNPTGIKYFPVAFTDLDSVTMGGILNRATSNAVSDLEMSFGNVTITQFQAFIVNANLPYWWRAAGY